jgi:hypothetical protein
MDIKASNIILFILSVVIVAITIIMSKGGQL